MLQDHNLIGSKVYQMRQLCFFNIRYERLIRQNMYSMQYLGGHGLPAYTRIHITKYHCIFFAILAF